MNMRFQTLLVTLALGPSLRAEGEAIQSAAQKAGLLRSARNDAGVVLTGFFTRSCAGMTLISVSPEQG
jgi:hypothetical protein